MTSKNSSVKIATVAVFLLAGLLTACKSSQQLPPIDQLEQPPSIRLNYYIASKDDSLYTVAWRYGVDFRDLAQRNNIAAPYTLHAGQKVMLADDDGRSMRGSRGVSAGNAVSAGPGVQVVAVAQNDSPVTEVASTGAPAAARPVAASQAGSAAQLPPPATSSVKPAASTAAASGRWIWPTEGRVITTFVANDPLRKGIDLEGKLGDPVKAAGAGNVVYAGSGLTGYGQLVIIKHSDQFLSAYAHNSKLLVAEGDAVKSGQVIAEVGSSGTDKNKLHFEIRQSGKPVDPLLYLPKK
ncbi:MAG: peptidoglycan DD-metalloendopeptidase family protein [Pseudomonadales bacterium]|nr:peptidoglycan DD-metalloendopeptidase family protein [Pseudomonadales bacterium]